VRSGYVTASAGSVQALREQLVEIRAYGAPLLAVAVGRLGGRIVIRWIEGPKSGQLGWIADHEVADAVERRRLPRQRPGSVAPDGL
jgi:hypothetical protein